MEPEGWHATSCSQGSDGVRVWLFSSVLTWQGIRHCARDKGFQEYWEKLAVGYSRSKVSLWILGLGCLNSNHTDLLSSLGIGMTVLVSLLHTKKVSCSAEPGVSGSELGK